MIGTNLSDTAKTWLWSTPRRRFLAGTLLLMVITTAAYAPAAGNGYVWDDDDYVYENPTLRSARGLRRIWFDVGATPQYYPLVHTSYWVEYRLWGLDPTGYHVTNILLHAAGTVLLWRVLRRLDVSVAWVAAAVFALHPVQVESVAWITERKNVLSGALYFGAALAYLRYALPRGGKQQQEQRRRGSRVFFVLALVLFVLALLAKTVTCSLPAALLLVLWWKKARIRLRDAFDLLPMFAAGLCLALLTVWMEKHSVGAQGTSWDLSFVQRILIAGRALWFYARKLVWPHPLVFAYPRWEVDAGHWWQCGFPVAAAGSVAALWLARRRLGRGPLVGALFFCGTLFPALGFFDVLPMRYSFVADHFQYLACVGLIVPALEGARRLAARFGSRRLAGVAMAALLLPLLGTLTWQRTYAYRDLETLWRDTLRKNPEAWIAHHNLAKILSERGEAEKAVRRYRRALRLEPEIPETHNNLGAELRQKGKLEEAAHHLAEALRIWPDYAMAHYNLGLVLQQQGKIREAIAEYRHALRVKPDYPLAHLNLGLALQATGRTDAAIEHYREALRLEPNLARAHNNMGLALQSKNRIAGAIRHFRSAVRLKAGNRRASANLQRALRLRDILRGAMERHRRKLAADPEDAEAHFNLGLGLAALGEPQEAAAHLRETLRINPGHARAHSELGKLLLLRQGRLREAVAHLREALRLNPSRREARDLLEKARRMEGRGTSAARP